MTLCAPHGQAHSVDLDPPIPQYPGHQVNAYDQEMEATGPRWAQLGRARTQARVWMLEGIVHLGPESVSLEMPPILWTNLPKAMHLGSGRA